MLIFRRLKPETTAAIDWQAQEITALLPRSDYAAESVAAEGTVFVILEEEKVIGLAAMPEKLTETKPVCGVLECLVILPAYRRQCLGRMLAGLIANALAERSVWFMAGSVPQSPEAEAFAKAIGMKPCGFLDGMSVLDLSDVDGLRYG